MFAILAISVYGTHQNWRDVVAKAIDRRDNAAVVTVHAVYPGASAQVVADTVAAPIEQQVNGVEYMLYMRSRSTDDGAYRLDVAFKPGVDLDAARTLIQSRVNLALPVLPDAVIHAGVTVKRSSTGTRAPIDFAVYGVRDRGEDELRQLAKRLVNRLKESKKLTDIGTTPDLAFVRQLYFDIDRAKARTAGVAVGDIFAALQAGLSGPDVRDLNHFGRSLQLKPPAGDGRPKQAADITKLKVRNRKGEMVPISSVVTVRETMVPPVLDRFDLWPMVEITAKPAPGVALSQARAYARGWPRRSPRSCGRRKAIG